MRGETTVRRPLSGSVLSACAAGLLAMAFVPSPLRGQGATNSDPAITKAVAYVRDYTKSLASVVCDEQQTQRVVKHDGKISKQRELTSEVLFIDTGGSHAFSLVVFRDVLAVDGKPVKSREDRLRKLLTEPHTKALDQAIRITREGARHNIGAFAGKKGNVDPLVQAIWWFGSDFQSGRFNRMADGVSFSQGTRRTEPGRGGKQELAVHGRYVIDGNGRVSETLWATDDPVFDTRIIVRYQPHPKLDVLVPSDMQLHEQVVSGSKPDRSEADVTYTNCRQFEVTVEESVHLPKP